MGKLKLSFLTTAIGLIASVALLPLPSRADYTTTLNPATTWGIWEGWGCSLCWWANVFGTRDDMADVLFTTNTVSFNGQSLPGLGMNIARYNAGACSWNSIGGATMVLSSNIPPFKQMNGFWLDSNSTNVSSSSWNWSVDANQRTMLQKAKARGANLLELFSNSPMWWMCRNHNPCGATGGSNDNLPAGYYDQHAIYLASVAGYARDHWGITFTSVEPFNEPVTTWWHSTGTQEGCHFDTGTQSSVIGYLRTELDHRGLANTIVAASDENTYTMALSTWNAFSPTIRSLVGRVNVHGYEYSGGKRDSLYSAVAGRKLWNTEYGEDDATGRSLARNLNLDFRWLHNTAWCYWQPFDGGGWGLIQSKPSHNWVGAANPKYYVLAQYSRHIKPGYTIIDGGETNTIAAYDATAKKLVIVTANPGTAQWINYNLTNFTTVGGPITRWMTQMSASGEKYQSHSDTGLSGKTFRSWFPTNTVQTFEVQNVTKIRAHDSSH